MAFVESEVVELKAEVVGDICKEVIAFANTKGGTLYIGVSNEEVWRESKTPIKSFCS